MPISYVFCLHHNGHKTKWRKSQSGAEMKRSGLTVALRSMQLSTISVKKIRINIDVAVKAAEWDPIKQFVKGRTQDAYDKNILIADARAKITDILVRARLTGEAISPTKFNTLFHRPADTGSFIDFARRNLAVLRAGYQWETQRHHSGVIAKLEQYRPGPSY